MSRSSKYILVLSAFVLMSTCVVGQKIGYLGKRVSLTGVINISQKNLSGYDFHYHPQFVFLYTTARTRELKLTAGTFSTSERGGGIQRDVLNGTTFSIGVRSYRYKNFHSIAPVGKFWDIEIMYFNTTKTVFESPIYGEPRIETEYDYGFVLPTISFGRQVLLADMILLNMGIRAGTWPFVVVSGFDSYATKKVRNQVFKSNLGAFFLTVGILL